MPIWEWIKRAGTLNGLMALFERGWGWLLIAGLGGGLFTWLATATKWLNAYGPIAWGGAAAFGVLVSMTLFAIWARIVLWLELRESTKLRNMIPDSLNPLEDTFEKRRLDINIFRGPLSEWNDNKTFIECEIMGPATVLFGDNSIIQNSAFKNCDPVLIKDDVPVHNAILFKNITARNCQFYNLTILVTPASKASFDRISGFQYITKSAL